MTLTKSDIVRSIYNQCSFSRTTSVQLVDSMIEIVISTLEIGESVLISGFGKFSVLDKGRRRGRNPQTGNSLILDARKVVAFRCSGVLRDKMNGERYDPK